MHRVIDEMRVRVVWRWWRMVMLAHVVEHDCTHYDLWCLKGRREGGEGMARARTHDVYPFDSAAQASQPPPACFQPAERVFYATSGDGEGSVERSVVFVVGPLVAF
jgi:hypothetical protein